jgi:steroid delta-isomerase-like uncharacterized protein
LSIQNQQTLKNFIEAVWNQGNIDAIPEFVATEYSIHHDPGDPWDGQTLTREGFQERVRVSREPIPDQRFDIQRVYSDADTVCITWLWQGTHRGEISGFAPTGRALRMSGTTVYSFDPTGRITGHWQIADRFGIYQQLTSDAE